MATQNAAAAGQELPARRVTEREAWSAPGVRVLASGTGMLLAGAALLVLGIAQGPGAGPTALIAVSVVLILAGELAVHGLTPVVAGEARAVQLFGRYRGTIRQPGLHWVNPFARRRKVSVRIRNQESAQAKVNDADGNPIEIAAVVVWQVKDTAMALYSVDDFTQFVTIQTETAVRHIASSYPYTSHGSGE
ncbi:MAG TPA: SPFH domain-containing protein, partial [Streptosporangiaceae bacterium]|nr:SPFH domain-containing protein [Streptosporangiaceae bacterium]